MLLKSSLSPKPNNPLQHRLDSFSTEKRPLMTKEHVKLQASDSGDNSGLCWCHRRGTFLGSRSCEHLGSQAARAAQPAWKMGSGRPSGRSVGLHSACAPVCKELLLRNTCQAQPTSPVQDMNALGMLLSHKQLF